MRVALLLVFLLLPEWALVGFFTAGAALSSPASVPRAVDVVVVLGGGADRQIRGKALVLAGYSQHLLVIHASEQERKALLASLPDGELIFDNTPRHTWDEALMARTRMQANGWHTALVVSDPPHLLRVAYSWSSAFRGTDLTYTLLSSEPPWWPGWRWWRNPISAGFVESEVLKLGYYVLRYPLGFELAWIAASLRSWQ